MSLVKEIDSVQNLREESDKIQGSFINVNPLEISSWGNNISYFPSSFRNLTKIRSPYKLPKIRIQDKNKLKTSTKKFFNKKINESDLTLANKFNSLNSAKILCNKNESNQKIVFTKNFSMQTCAKSANQVLIPSKVNFSAYRVNLFKALQSCDTIEELLKTTKINKKRIAKMISIKKNRQLYN